MDKNKKGFTLVELAIVISVIAILSAVLIPTFSGIVARAKESARMQSVMSAKDEFFTGSGQFESLEDMEGYVFEIDGYTYVVNKGKIVEDNTINIEELQNNGQTISGDNVLSNPEITIYSPVERVQGSAVINGVEQTWRELKANGIIHVTDGVLTIDDNFREEIDSIVVDNSITQLGNSAFGWCYNLKSVTLPETLTVISNNALYACPSLEYVNIPDSVTSIGERAFSGLYFEELILPRELRTIGEGAFEYCDNVTNIVFNDKLEEIGDNAFSTLGNNTNASIHIDFPDSLISIGEYAFVSSRSLKTLRIGKNVSLIGNNPFYQCENLESIIIDEENEYFTSGETNNYILGRNDGRLVSIITPYTMPDDNSVRIITKELFAYSNLQTLVIPEGVTTIEDEAFGSCQSLTSITFPSTITSLGNKIFNYCNYIEEIIVNSDENSRYIGDGNAIIERDTDTLVFGCRLSTIPDYIKHIADYAFSHKVLNSVTLPEGLLSIGEYSFEFCYFESVNIPASVTSIHPTAFRNCEYVTSFTVDYENEYYTTENSNCLIEIETKTLFIAFKTTVLSSQSIIETIYEEAFRNLHFTSTTDIVLPSSVKVIGTRAFYDSSLTSLTFGTEVESVGEYAFEGIDNNAVLYFNGSQSQFDEIEQGENAFGSATIICTGN